METVLITGVAGGMGQAAAKRFMEAGWEVWGLDIRPVSLPGLHALQADLTDLAAVEAAAAELREAGIRLRALIHMAGIYELDSLVELEEERWERCFRVNLGAAYRVNRAFLPLLEPNARILITTSELATLDPLPFTGIYAITKTALDSYAASLRMELQLLGIRVIVLRPGAVDTKLLDVSTARLEAFCKKTSHYAPNAARFRQIVDRVESRKIPPEQVAELALRAAVCRHPRDAYSINRNPLLVMMNCLPNRLQQSLIRGVLKKRPDK